MWHWYTNNSHLGGGVMSWRPIWIIYQNITNNMRVADKLCLKRGCWVLGNFCCFSIYPFSYIIWDVMSLKQFWILCYPNFLDTNFERLLSVCKITFSHENQLRPSLPIAGTVWVKPCMCNDGWILRNILVGKIGYCNHAIISPKDYRPHCVNGEKLSSLIATH